VYVKSVPGVRIPPSPPGKNLWIGGVAGLAGSAGSRTTMPRLRGTSEGCPYGMRRGRAGPCPLELVGWQVLPIKVIPYGI
jgi:hypothetical protein